MHFLEVIFTLFYLLRWVRWSPAIIYIRTGSWKPSHMVILNSLFWARTLLMNPRPLSLVILMFCKPLKFTYLTWKSSTFSANGLQPGISSHGEYHFHPPSHPISGRVDFSLSLTTTAGHWFHWRLPHSIPLTLLPLLFPNPSWSLAKAIRITS